MAIRNGRRALHDQDGVAPWRLQESEQAFAVAVAGGVPQDVDRVSTRPGGRQYRIEPLDRVIGERRELTVALSNFIDGEHAKSASVRQNTEAIAFDAHARGQNADRLEQLGECVHAKHPGSPECRLIDRVRTRERAGVRERCLCARFGASRFDNHNRFGALGHAGGRQKFPRMGDRLDVKQNGVGIGVQRQIVQKVSEIDVAHRA